MTTNNNQHPTPPPIRIPLSPLENLTVGAFGGALETTIQMPILTAKFCIQEGRAYPPTISGWYRGVLVQSSTVAPITALQFLVNGLLQSLALRGSSPRDLTDAETITTAAGAGAISAIVYGPVDLVTIQQQKLHLDPIRTLRRVVATYGWRNGIFRGFGACAARESIYTAGYLGFAPVVTARLLKSDYFDRERPFAAGVMGACVAGTGAAFLTHPVDTAKTCVQADMRGERYGSARVAMRLLVEEGGVRSLFKGFTARTVRVCGAFFICMSIREMAIDYKTSRGG